MPSEAAWNWLVRGVQTSVEGTVISFSTFSTSATAECKLIPTPMPMMHTHTPMAPIAYQQVHIYRCRAVSLFLSFIIFSLFDCQKPQYLNLSRYTTGLLCIHYCLSSLNGRFSRTCSQLFADWDPPESIQYSLKKQGRIQIHFLPSSCIGIYAHLITPFMFHTALT